ncbi:division/cell wall cluster transcriptional repressor MraZ [Mycoplasma sp. ATU-Cv-703]|uniref:division/cell wall cluster transcriptional repressor MraZ n=1 Tax=Mycoplasma sp. ATU-Cv-703 TaxID=2498595 RepID=UPI000FDE11C7
MFGNFERSLDQKKRVIVPVKLRQELGMVFYATIGPDKVLELRDADSFNLWKSKLLGNNMLNSKARIFARLLLGNTAELNVDGQGRVMLPDHLIQGAQITRDVVFVGVGNKVELWPAETFKKFQKDHSGGKSLEELAQKLLEDGGQF